MMSPLDFAIFPHALHTTDSDMEKTEYDTLFHAATVCYFCRMDYLFDQNFFFSCLLPR